MKKLLGVIALGIGAIGAIAYASDPDMAVSVWLFWFGAGVLVVQWVLAQKGRSPRSQHMGEIVQLCIGQPVQSPTVAQATCALPKYCRSTLNTAV